MSDFLSPQETQLAQPGQVVVKVDASNWKTWNNASGLTGAVIGMVLVGALPGTPLQVVTIGRFPNTAFNLGAGNPSDVVAGVKPSRGTTGQIIGTCDASGEIFLLPSTVGQPPEQVSLPTVSNIATLRTTAVSPANAVVLLGYYSPGDTGGDSIYFWNASDTTPDNGGSVISNGLGTGRWNLVITGPVNVKSFGAKGDGVTSDVTAWSKADSVALNDGRALYAPPGTYLVTGISVIESEIEFESGAVLSGTVTLGGCPKNVTTRLIFQPGSTITFGPVALLSMPDMWVNWWGADPTGASDSTTAIKAALTCWSAAAAAVTQGTGQAPVLRFGAGTYLVTPTSNAPTFNLTNVVGGTIRGAGTGQTLLFQNGNAGKSNLPAVLRLTNCQKMSISDFDIKMNTDAAIGINGAVAIGSTNIVTFGNANLHVGDSVTLFKNQYWWEPAKVTAVNVDGVTITIDRPTRFAYAANTDGTLNYVLPCPTACIQLWSDNGQSGLSTKNYVARMKLGNDAITSVLYGISVDCVGGQGGGGDFNNDLHIFEDITVANTMIAGAYLGHRNAINITFRGCNLSGIYAIHAPHGGTFNTFGCTLFAFWAVFGVGGTGSHACKSFGDIVEGNNPALVLADQYTNNSTFTTASFTQPAVGSTVSVTVDNAAGWLPVSNFISVGSGGYYSATAVGNTLTLTNLGCTDNAAPTTVIAAGQPVGGVFQGEVNIFGPDVLSGPPVTTVSATSSSGQKIITVTSTAGFRPGKTLTLSTSTGTLREKHVIAQVTPSATPGAGTITTVDNLTSTFNTNDLVTLSYHVDVSATFSYVSFTGGNLAFGQSAFPGNELKVVDVGTSTPGTFILGTAATELGIYGVQLGVVTWLVDHAVLSSFRGGFTANANATATLLHAGSAIILDGHQQTAPNAGSHSVGTFEGFDTIRSRTGTTTLTDSVSMSGAVFHATRTVTTATDTVDATKPDHTIFLNRAGTISVTLPFPSAGRVLRFFDISGAAGTNNITISGSSGANINGGATYVINTNRAGVQLEADGANWWVTGEYNGTVI